MPASRQRRWAETYTISYESFLSRGRGISRLRARPMGSAPWNPAAFEKAGETFSCAPRSPVQTLIRIVKRRFSVPNAPESHPIRFYAIFPFRYFGLFASAAVTAR